MAIDPRAAAHAILTEVRGGAFADQAAERVLPKVDERDRGLALEIGYGCLRLRARLDTWITASTDRPLKRVDPAVLDWLRIGMYQLHELRVPDHAAVSETVRRARRTMDPGRAGFINAVLRAATSGENADPFPSRDTEPLAYLSTYGSHPEWLVRRWLDRWGWHDTFRLVRQDNQAPATIVRLLGSTGPEDVARVAPDVGLKPIPGWPRSFELDRGPPAEFLSRIDAVVQDPAASAVVDYAGPALEGPVYDACAAPGTKAMVLASAHPEARPYLAGDRSPTRLERVREAAVRLRLRVQAAAMDARRPAIRRARTLLIDAPCTGTGALRRRPDARWRIDPQGLESLVAVQRDMLEACAEIVEPGGLLVYSTCSLEPEENELQVEEFLARHPEFARERLDGIDWPAKTLTPEGDLFVRPWMSGTDGAYAARLRREAT